MLAQNDSHEPDPVLIALGARLNLDELATKLPSFSSAMLPAHLQDPPELWERTDLESDHEWSLFREWRDSAYPGEDFERPQDRMPLTVLARSHGIGSSWIYTLSSKRAWPSRATAYDRMLDRARTKAAIGTVEELYEAHRRDCAVLREGVTTALNAWVAGIHDGTVQMRPSELLAYAKTLHELERLTHGQSTENVSVKVSFTLDELRGQLGVAADDPQARQKSREALRAALKGNAP